MHEGWVGLGLVFFIAENKLRPLREQSSDKVHLLYIYLEYGGMRRILFWFCKYVLSLLFSMLERKSQSAISFSHVF